MSTCEPLHYKNSGFVGYMKKGKRGKKDTGRRPYVGPGIKVLTIDSDKAKELGEALRGSSPDKCEEVDAAEKSKTSKAKKRTA